MHSSQRYKPYFDLAGKLLLRNPAVLWPLVVYQLAFGLLVAVLPIRTWLREAFLAFLQDNNVLQTPTGNAYFTLFQFGNFMVGLIGIVVLGYSLYLLSLRITPGKQSVAAAWKFIGWNALTVYLAPLAFIPLIIVFFVLVLLSFLFGAILSPILSNVIMIILGVVFFLIVFVAYLVAISLVLCFVLQSVGSLVARRGSAIDAIVTAWKIVRARLVSSAVLGLGYSVAMFLLAFVGASPFIYMALKHGTIETIVSVTTHWPWLLAYIVTGQLILGILGLWVYAAFALRAADFRKNFQKN